MCSEALQAPASSLLLLLLLLSVGAELSAGPAGLLLMLLLLLPLPEMCLLRRDRATFLLLLEPGAWREPA